MNISPFDEKATSMGFRFAKVAAIPSPTKVEVPVPATVDIIPADVILGRVKRSILKHRNNIFRLGAPF